MENLGLVDPGFWRDRRVFMTGHTGFKGAWLSLWLTHMGAKLTGYALTPPTTPSLFELTQVAQGMTSLIGDIRDLDKMQRALSDAQPELVIHMAAQALVRPSYATPVDTYATNVMGTVHVLENVRHCPSVRAALVITSDKCYENIESMTPYRESDPMGGYDPYSNSKGCAELVTAAYRQSFFHPNQYTKHGVAIASARAGNVIGGGDWAEDRLVPDAMRAVLSNKELEVRNPRAIRPWQHVLDPLNGYLQLCQQLLSGEAMAFAESWNFGPAADSEQSVEHVLTLLKREWGPQAVWKHVENPNQPHEAHYLRLNCEKARGRLKWQPRYALDKALALTASWYKTYANKGDLRALTFQQIDDIMHPVCPPRTA